ncbi:6-phospho-3-hexuloisomerase [Okibacterium fritillariae]|uniref:3-hexulose-6-phosphate isomerase n=1 Tax=Okibacterium fritillariae TaxID=123320 RepID=A0A1T5KX94_9MICO|nr:6-phospho-3-hexuloisomerase [Okibacterium fritillariae]SKC68396.1 3-hexulose-6-phosphate isomerase [Okibacterium fritillariae]
MPADTDTEATALAAIMAELDALADSIDDRQLEAVAHLLSDADRVFVQGAGRSGFALQMTAMRLMHLGLTVFVVGETTTPAIREGDVLLTASGSGTTGSVVHAAETARSVSARIAAITTAADSPLADLADVAIVVPAATKLDRSGTASAQYAGSLFEQSVVLIGDAVFHQLWKASGLTADDIWPRHANLE